MSVSLLVHFSNQRTVDYSPINVLWLLLGHKIMLFLLFLTLHENLFIYLFIYLFMHLFIYGGWGAWHLRRKVVRRYHHGFWISRCEQQVVILLVHQDRLVVCGVWIVLQIISVRSGQRVKNFALTASGYRQIQIFGRHIEVNLE